MGPLEGVRVVDLTSVVSGPFATMWLADQGAEVIKIEPPGLGDQGRSVGPGFAGFSALFATCNRNKRSACLDLRRPEAVAVVHRLAAAADVVVENFRPGVSDRLGVGWGALEPLNPRLVYCHISGYGDTGPYADRRTYDSIVQAGSGLADAQVGADGGPSLVHSIICDKVTGLAAAQAICAALAQRGGDGRGRRVDLSMLEVMLAFNWPDVMWNETFRSPRFRPGLAVSDTYRLWKTADGAVAVVFITDSAFSDWCSALDAPPEVGAERFETEMASRYRWRELWPLWEERLAAMPTAEAVARFHAAGVPAGPLLRRDELADDPQVRSRGAVVEIEDPLHGPTRIAAAPVRFGGQAPALPAPAPRLGQHTREVLSEAGYGEAEISALLGTGAAVAG
jgi:crotonobetainyl-CoA:carnitine CoA-transferase CaiB-like acyl-CoA transferase